MALKLTAIALGLILAASPLAAAQPETDVGEGAPAAGPPAQVRSREAGAKSWSRSPSNACGRTRMASWW